MRRFGLLLLGVSAALFLRRRRTGRTRESVGLHYADGSMVTLEPSTPGYERLVALARQAF
jgi:hypothetical protein